MYVCECVYTGVYIRVCVCWWVCVLVDICVWVDLYVCEFMSVYIVYVSVCADMYVYVYM